MAARLALVLAMALLGLVLGLVWAPVPSTVVAPARGLRVASARLDPPGLSTAQAASAFAGMAPVAALAAPLRKPPRPVQAQMLRALPPPPPPAPESVLSRSVAAVEDGPGGLSLVLAGGARRLRTGDSFMGWRLASVSRAGAVLSRSGERREASFFAGPSGPPLASAAALSAVGAASRVAPSARVRPEPAPPTAAEYFRGFKG